MPTISDGDVADHVYAQEGAGPSVDDQLEQPS